MAPPHKPITDLGSVAANGNGWRARVQLDGINSDGPQRATQSEAQADLDRARQCKSRADMANCLVSLANVSRCADNSVRALHADTALAANGAAQPTADARCSGVAQPAVRVRAGRSAASTFSGDAGAGLLSTRSESLGRRASNTGSTDALPEFPTSSGAAQPAADVTCSVMVKSIDTPWCDDVAAGLKFFECVANRVCFVNQFKRLQAGDLFVVLRTRDAKRVTAVAQVQGRQLERQSDRSLLTQHLQDGRHEALRNFLGDAKTFNAVFFDKVYDCRTLNMNLSALVARVPGLQEPRSLNGPGFLTTSREVRDALLSFLDSCGCSVRYTRAPRVPQSRSSPY